MLKVLVVDDDSPIRRWLEYCIGQLEGFVLAGSAATGTQGLETVPPGTAGHCSYRH